MAYNKTIWENAPSTNTPINAANLNKIEQGIYDNSIAIDSIIESGNNANGDYIKYANGDMIIFQKISGTINVTKSWGNLYSSDAINFLDFPEEFIAIPEVICYPIATTSNQFWLATAENNNSTKTNGGSVILVRPVSSQSVSYQLNIIAIGKWK